MCDEFRGQNSRTRTRAFLAWVGGEDKCTTK